MVDFLDTVLSPRFLWQTNVTIDSFLSVTRHPCSTRRPSSTPAQWSSTAPGRSANTPGCFHTSTFGCCCSCGWGAVTCAGDMDSSMDQQFRLHCRYDTLSHPGIRVAEVLRPPDPLPVGSVLLWVPKKARETAVAFWHCCVCIKPIKEVLGIFTHKQFSNDIIHFILFIYF